LPEAETGDDHKDMQNMRQDVYPPGGGAALARLLHGMSGEVSAGGDDHGSLSGLRATLQIRIVCPAMAQILQGMSIEAEGIQEINTGKV
jgi:hypothetical protein